jgi:hypothetical protein
MTCDCGRPGVIPSIGVIKRIFAKGKGSSPPVEWVGGQRFTAAAMLTDPEPGAREFRPRSRRGP